MGKGDDLVKYITTQIVSYVERPDTVRQQRAAKRSVKPPWQVRWFGMLPVSLGMWFRKRK